MSDKVMIVTDADFDKAVLQSAPPVLVDFWAPWCGPCKMMAPVLDALADEMDAESLVIAKLNVDENASTVGKYGIMSIPTLVMFRDGVESGKLVGFMPKDELRTRIETLLEVQSTKQV